MHVITLTCSQCGTIVAANELERRRVMNCPGRACDAVLGFEDLPEADREYFLEHRDRYRV